MKRTIIFSMLALCLFGAVAVANAATELTEDQMARQFGGCFLDPETNCISSMVADQWAGKWFWGCTETGEECEHMEPEEYQHWVVVCICYRSDGTYYYACTVDYNEGYELGELESMYEDGYIIQFYEDTYPRSGGYPPFSL